MKNFHSLFRGYKFGSSLGNTIGFWVGMIASYQVYRNKDAHKKNYLGWCLSPFVTTFFGTYLGSRYISFVPASRLINRVFYSAPLRHFYLNIGLFGLCYSKILVQQRKINKIKDKEKPRPCSD